jgi:geranylgeranyl diphosphate synthase type I
MAFQIRDDLLGLWGESPTLGKQVGADLLRNKRSLPILLALSRDHPVRDRLREALAAGVRDETEAATLAAELEAAGVRVRCEEMAQEYVTRALAALEEIPLCEGPAADLRLLASYLAERKE